MKIAAKLTTLQKVFLDTAPIIYFVEQNPTYFSRSQPIFEAIDQGAVTAVTSPITLAECLIFPLQKSQTSLIQIFSALIVQAEHTEFVATNDVIGLKAAELRVLYNLTLTDALQIATAISVHCDGFLTNDLQLKKVQGIEIICLQDFDTESIV